MTLRRLLDILVPRFVTEDVALKHGYCGHCEQLHVLPVCSMADIRPGEVFDGIATLSGFNLFGFMFFQRQVGDIRPFVNPHDARPAA